MRNLIFKTILATSLASISFAPFARADRQGGGGLAKVVFDDTTKFTTLSRAVLGQSQSDVAWVRFGTVDQNQVSFDLFWKRGSENVVQNVVLPRGSFDSASADLVKALVDSKQRQDWVALPTK